MVFTSGLIYIIHRVILGFFFLLAENLFWKCLVLLLLDQFILFFNFYKVFGFQEELDVFSVLLWNLKSPWTKGTVWVLVICWTGLKICSNKRMSVFIQLMWKSLLRFCRWSCKSSLFWARPASFSFCCYWTLFFKKFEQFLK